MNELDVILKADFMNKKGKKSWKNFSMKWFILTTNYLKYYNGSPEKGFQSLKRNIELQHIKYIENVDFEEFCMDYAFQISYYLGDKFRHLYIIANSDEQRHSWIETIKSACKFSCRDRTYENSTECVFPDSEGRPMWNNMHGSNQMCVAITDYVKESDSELSLSILEGEILKIIFRKDTHWLKVENNNQIVGFVPYHLVKVLPLHCSYEIKKHNFRLLGYMTKRAQLEKLYRLRPNKKRNIMSTHMQKTLVDKLDNDRKRWFLLNEQSLKYYDGTMETGLTCEKNSIALKDVKIIEKMENDVFFKTNVFQIMYTFKNNNSFLYIEASSEHQREVWMNALRNACYNAGATFFKRYHPRVWFFEYGMFSCCSKPFRNSIGCEKASSNSCQNISIFPSKRYPGNINYTSESMGDYPRKDASDPVLYCEQSLLSLVGFEISI